MAFECHKCERVGLKYQRKYRPIEFLEGRRNSLIWIVGLNPKGDLGTKDERDAEELQNCLEGEIYPYFRDFRRVSQRLYDLLGKDRGVAHTDIVKCFSEQFPVRGWKGEHTRSVINNCKEYLGQQIREFRPRIIVCNGSVVSQTLRTIITPEVDCGTSYIGHLDGRETVVVLSGFIGRIDNYAKARLGKEIEIYMERYGI